jgi:hypothetical protein
VSYSLIHWTNIDFTFGLTQKKLPKGCLRQKGQGFRFFPCFSHPRNAHETQALIMGAEFYIFRCEVLSLFLSESFVEPGFLTMACPALLWWKNNGKKS